MSAFRAENLAALLRTLRLVAEGGPLENMLAEIARTAVSLYRADRVVGVELAQGGGPARAREYDAEGSVRQTAFAAEGTVHRWVATSNRPFRSSDVMRDRRPLARTKGLETMRGVRVFPVRASTACVGTLLVARLRPWPLQLSDVVVLAQLADCVSLAMRREPGTATVTEAARTAPPIPAPRPQVPLPLTIRQADIARLLCDGATAKEIALRLAISPRTVEHHLERLKLRFRSSTLHGLVGRLASVASERWAPTASDASGR